MKNMMMIAALLPALAFAEPAFVMRFDDNKPTNQWLEVAEIFESAGIRLTTYSHIAE